MLLNTISLLLIKSMSIAWMLQILLPIVFAILVYEIVQNRRVRRKVRHEVEAMQATHDMMDNALKMVVNNVIIYDPQTETIRQLNGQMLPNETVSVEEFKKHIHTDDVEKVVEGIQQVKNGEVPVAEFDYRWNYSQPGETPRWIYLHNASVAEYEKDGKTLSCIICVLFDETDPYHRQMEEEALFQKYKQIFENSIVGLSFYSAEGWLLDANKIMREICHFDTETGDAFFSSTNLFDVFPFNEVLDRNHPEEYWGCSLSVIPERNMRVYLEIGVHPIYDREGKLSYISIATRDVSSEREMYLQVKKNDVDIQKINKSIMIYEQELRYMMETCGLQSWRISLESNTIEFYHGLSTVIKTFSLDHLRDIFMNPDNDYVHGIDNPEKIYSKPLNYVGLMKPMITGQHTEPQWIQINSVPEFDEDGKLKGAFGIWRNIDKLIRKQEELKHETERANDSGRMKSAFLANMTHEIRTPLNAIVGFSDVLPMLSTPDERTEMLRLIMDNCDMLMRLVNDIQAAAAFDSTGGVQITLTKVDFAKFFNDICESMSQRVQSPDVEFIKDSPYPTYLTRVDEAHLRQVFTNFVTNAVKYTKQGHIKLGYRKEWREEEGPDGTITREGLYLYCEDTGEGVPKESHEKIFDRFFKLNDYIQGTGLGLSICKAIADACQGYIGVQSEGKDCGSTFWMWIPCEELKE